jgi:putative FmdB family regulatory protein
MPLYEYQCEKCEQRFERIQKFSDPPVETCPTCGGKVRKLLSSPAIQFKGSGWYITDYAKKGGSTDGSAPASDAASGSKGTKTDASAKTESASGSSADKPAAAPAPAKMTKSE